MSTLASLTSDTFYFPRATTTCSSATLNSSEPSVENVKEGVRAILGADFKFTCELSFKPTGLALFDILSTILPFTYHSSFFWTKAISYFASMLTTANFPLSSQLSFLVFIYARVLGFMGPIENPNSVMTTDGSPIELSWVIPNRSTPRPGEPTRQVRFAIEPLHPILGTPLRGAEVLAYLAGGKGGLGIVECDVEGGAMNWRKKTEEFLFSGSDVSDGEIPEGSRFFVGFDFTPNGTLTLKAYYLVPARPPSVSRCPYPSSTPTRPQAQQKANFPIHCGDVDFTPLRSLIPRLDPSMTIPSEKILNYLKRLNDPKLKPTFQILAMDCVSDNVNRLKIYCRTMEATSWSDVVRSFTLGDALSSPSILASIKVLEKLWNALFPSSSSSTPGRGLNVAKTADREHEHFRDNLANVNVQNPVGGILYYYEITSGQEDQITPKIYLPVRHYCDSDLTISQALEEFYESVGVHGPVGGEVGQGWVGREITKAFNHRDLGERSGIQTYITFAAKKAGWEVTSYFSPELWA